MMVNFRRPAPYEILRVYLNKRFLIWQLTLTFSIGYDFRGHENLTIYVNKHSKINSLVLSQGLCTEFFVFVLYPFKFYV